MQSVPSPTDSLLATHTDALGHCGHRIFENVPYGALTMLEAFDHDRFALKELHWETDFLLPSRQLLFWKRPDGAFFALSRHLGPIVIVEGARIDRDETGKACVVWVQDDDQAMLTLELTAWVESLRTAKFTR